MGNALNKTLNKRQAVLRTPDIFKGHGYPAETHQVVTRDGYRVALHRIPGGKDSRLDTPVSPPARAVLLQHGLLCDSTVFAVTPPDKGLAYLLADRGYDVWLGNSRGTSYSRDHETLSPDDPASGFWDFTWHEMGTLDLPAVTDYILGVTKRPQITYVGHSQGCTQFFVMGSERPEYNKKFDAMFGLAPAVYISNARALLLKEPWRTLLQPLFKKPEVYKRGSLECRTMRKTSQSQLASKVCVMLMSAFVGESAKQVDVPVLRSFLSVYPSSAASKQVAHFQQLVDGGGFCRFDHGPERNVLEYGQPSAPHYRLDRVTCPVTLFAGLNDYLTDPEDVKRVYKELGNPAGFVTVPFPEFSHMDFLWARDAKELLYDDLLNRIDQVARDQKPRGPARGG